MMWFKMSNGVPDDPKILKLPDKLFRTWMLLLCAASRNDGHLPPLEDCALICRLSTSEMLKRVEDLTARKLIDQIGLSRIPHNWHKWQYMTGAKDPAAAERQRRYRERNRNALSNGHDDVTEDVT